MNTNAVKIEFICGTTVDRSGMVLDIGTVEAAKHVAGELFLAEFGGYSKSIVEGAWRSPTTGQVAHDVSIVYSCIALLAPSQEHITALQAKLATAFRQESVPFIQTRCFVQF